MSAVSLAGFWLLAGGALLGWPLALSRIDPKALRRIGIRYPKRILQMHIDFLMMGILAIAVGVALPDLPAWAAVPLVVGAVVNPILFLPLAIRASFEESTIYRAVSVASFTAMSAGTVGAAVYATQTYL
ncbi:MAG: hypothetical protein QM809_14075 [Gordonia sp. (in: high G+C Gram-positive bacteria)]|uniref:hypothetical protein n=1 Tax=Gordonia sp. (in: high G+C Gram-positive bacteria) TaxID=84139 RepID=UPI0039E403B2